MLRISIPKKLKIKNQTQDQIEIIEEEKIELNDESKNVQTKNEEFEYKEKQTEEEAKKKEENPSDIDKSILAEVYKNNYQLKDTEDIPNLKSDNERFKEELDLSKVEEEINNLKSTPDKRSGDNNKPKSFSSWLYSNNESNDIEPIGVGTKKPKVIYLEFDKPKREFYSPSKKAKESLSENSLPISETLAKIYASQGNIPKAIKIYEKLQLVFPEKKVFFASQIKKFKVQNKKLIMSGILITLITIASILLILVVYVQNPKGGGLSSDFGAAQQIGGVQKPMILLRKQLGH